MRSTCWSVSIKQCLILDLKIGVSFVYVTLPCMKFHIHVSTKMTLEVKKKRSPVSLSGPLCTRVFPALLFVSASSSSSVARPGPVEC